MTATTLRIRAAHGQAVTQRREVGQPADVLRRPARRRALLAPVLYIVLGASATPPRSPSTRPGFPHPWVFDNYPSVLTQRPSGRSSVNCAIIAVGTTAGVVVLGLMASFVLARYNFRGEGRSTRSSPPA